MKLRQLAAPLCAAVAAACAAGPAAAVEADPGTVGVATGGEVFAYGLWQYKGVARDIMGPPGYVDHEEDNPGSVVSSTEISESWWDGHDPTLPVSWSCSLHTACTQWSGLVKASADATGTLRVEAKARSWVFAQTSDSRVTGGHVVDATAGAVVNDTITLSKPATVQVRGLVHGYVGASTSNPDNGFPWPRELRASVGFWAEGGEAWDMIGGYSNEWIAGEPDPAAPLMACWMFLCPDDSTVLVPFAESVDLPAGTSAFVAQLRGAVGVEGYVDNADKLRPDGWFGAESDGEAAHVHAGDTMTFEIVVPDDVIVSSGSGLLPIVGGIQGEAPDETPPTVISPADLTVPNAPGRADAVVDPGTATAEDDRDGVTVEGARSDGLALDAPYPLGVTTITWTARDAAGNTASATQTVTVVDAEDPVLTLPSAVTADATSAAGAAVSYAASATDNSGAVSVDCSPASGSTFPVGTTTVTCGATDAAGNEARGTFAVAVRGPAEQLAGLIAFLPHQSLKAKAAAAEASLDRDDTTPACNQLGALLHHVAALDGKKLTAAEADETRERVARIMALIGC